MYLRLAEPLKEPTGHRVYERMARLMRCPCLPSTFSAGCRNHALCQDTVWGKVLFCHATPRDDEEVVLADSRLDRWREALSGLDTARDKRPSGRLAHLVGEPAEMSAGTRRLLEQTALRLAGIRTIPDRLVSLADPDARPIRKGKPQHPNSSGTPHSWPRTNAASSSTTRSSAETRPMRRN